MTTDLSKTIVPKSDQLNADDLIGGRSITIKITKVGVGASDQPVSISYEGDNGKPYKPGKSMRRLLVFAWGTDGAAYVGRYLTLYRDENVMFAGEKVGGIRISHMSNIEKTLTVPLTTTRGQRKPYTVQPLSMTAGEAPPPAAPAPLTPEEVEDAHIAARQGSAKLQEWWASLKATPGAQKRYQWLLPDLKKTAADYDANMLPQD